MLRKSFGFAICAVMVAISCATTSSAAILASATLVNDGAGFGAPDGALGAPWASYVLSVSATEGDLIQAANVINIGGQLHQRWSSSSFDGTYDTATGNSTNKTNGDSHFLAITAGSQMLFANGPNEDNPGTGSPLSGNNNDSTGWGVGTSMSATFGPAGVSVTNLEIAYIVIPKTSITDLDIDIDILNPGGDVISSLTCASFFGAACGAPPTTVVGDLALTANLLGETVNGNVPLTDVTTLTFDNINAPVFTPLIPGKTLSLPILPTLSNTGAFSWNTDGAKRGLYEWAITGVGGGTDTGKISVTVTQVPEPGTLALFGLAIAGVVGFARRRS